MILDTLLEFGPWMGCKKKTTCSQWVTLVKSLGTTAINYGSQCSELLLLIYQMLLETELQLIKNMLFAYMEN